MIAIGNIMAPAIRNPQRSSEKHAYKWVNQAISPIRNQNRNSREAKHSILFRVRQ
jgi:hypothetical protein